jgi:hypothetical protein
MLMVLNLSLIVLLISCENKDVNEEKKLNVITQEDFNHVVTSYPSYKDDEKRAAVTLVINYYQMTKDKSSLQWINDREVDGDEKVKDIIKIAKNFGNVP